MEINSEFPKSLKDTYPHLVQQIMGDAGKAICYKDIITNREYIYVNKGYNVTFNNIETSGTTILKDKHVNYFILVDSVTLSKRFISLNQ